MTTAELPLPARWRGETVTVVAVRGARAQIARRRGLRWVRLEELEADQRQKVAKGKR
jgi:hypothetical protein